MSSTTNTFTNQKIIGLIEPVGGHGGMDYYDYGLAMGLGNQEMHVRYYTCGATNVRSFRNVMTLKYFNHVWGRNILVKVSSYLKGHLKAFKELSRLGSDIVHLHFFSFRIVDFLVLRLGKFYGMKIVVTVHDVSSFHKKSSTFIEKKSYELIDGLIVHNQYSYDTLMSKKMVLCPVAIIPHGNYLPFITKIVPKIEEVEFTILFFGQIKQVKGLDILLKAFSLLQEKNVRLVIAGKAWKSDLDEYTTLINDLNISDTTKTDFRYIPDGEVASFYSKSDLIVLPYKEIYQSGVLLLSMSYGKPILCSDLPAFSSVIRQGINGFLFKKNDSEDLAKQISMIIDDRKNLSKVVFNANETIENDYDWNNIGKLTLDFYKLL
jgi:D-inositol-3-phosphate glycosyltransferase